jgi:hypothetical protein
MKSDDFDFDFDNLRTIKTANDHHAPGPTPHAGRVFSLVTESAFGRSRHQSDTTVANRPASYHENRFHRPTMISRR